MELLGAVGSCQKIISCVPLFALSHSEITARAEMARRLAPRLLYRYV